MPDTSLILIVDDTEVNRYTFSRLLRKAGYRTHEASSIADGLRLLGEATVDLIVLDVQLPDGNGFDVCARLKKSDAYASIPVLMTSASFTDARDKAQGLDYGADGYLTTPVDPLELVATAKALLRIKHTEDGLKIARRKAEAANIAKTEFLANMSHEIRTPMNAIIGLTNILAMTELSSRQKEFVTTLQRSADSLMTLINDMLDITKIEENMIELEQAPFKLKDVVERVLTIVQPQTQGKPVSLAAHYAPEVPEWFIGDAQRLHQILLNLISNAVKFTAAGAVDIGITRLPAGNGVAIAIADTGIGIAHEKLDVIFNKFTQADSSTTRKYGGSGLGLTIARRLIERMDGRIHVKSELGKGSLFTVELPMIATKFDERAQKPLSIPKEKRAGRILLVEDHAANILVAQTLLEELGYECVVATSGLDAIPLLHKQSFDAVLMDIQMQGMDGYEATRQIRRSEQENSLPRTPVIAMTANALVGDREKCISAGMDDYLAKPIRFQELERIVGLHMPALPKGAPEA